MDSKKIDQRIGLFLRKQQYKKEYSQEFVANQLNMSRNTYQTWEKGDVDFSMSKILIICQLYQIEMIDFWREVCLET
jgi:transcriptional regulator with XRE-family HTH domain